LDYVGLTPKFCCERF